MHNEFSMTAKPKSKLAHKVLLGLIGSSVIFVAAAELTPKLSGIIWTVAFVFIVATLYVYNRYVGAEFCYSVENVGTPSLIVTQRVGKTVKTLARLDISSIKEIRRMTREEHRTYKCDRVVNRYSYFPTMCPDEIYLVTIRSTYENADLFIEIDENFASALRARVAEEAANEGYDPY